MSSSNVVVHSVKKIPESNLVSTLLRRISKKFSEYLSGTPVKIEEEEKIAGSP